MNFMRDAQSLAFEVARQTEQAMLEQLGDLVKSGLLVWEDHAGDAVITHDPMSGKFKISQLGRFRLREQEAFDALKSENESLRAQLRSIREAIG